MRYQVILDGEPVDLPRKGFEVLYELARHPNQVLSAEQEQGRDTPSRIHRAPISLTCQ